MPSLTFNQPWKSLRRLRAQQRLGIDIGEFSTKIVRYTVGAPYDFACATLPTEAGLHESAVLAAEVLPAHILHAEATSEEPSEKAAPLNDVYRIDFSRWSDRQLSDLAQRITTVAGSRGSARAVSVAISMAACDFRSLHVPAGETVSGSSIRQRIQEVTGDTRPRCVALVPSPRSESKVRVLSIPEELTAGLAMKLDRRGLTPGRIEGIPWSLAGMMSGSQPYADQIQLVLDWGFSQPTLVSVVDGKIDYIRRLGAGGILELITPTMDQLQLSRTEAIRWLTHCYAATQSPTAAGQDTLDHWEWITACCQRLAADINTAIEFIHWRNQGRKVQEICLTGGAPQLPGLFDQLQSELLVPARVWEFGQNGHQLTSEYATAAAVAGLLEEPRG